MCCNPAAFVCNIEISMTNYIHSARFSYCYWRQSAAGGALACISEMS